MTPCKLCGKKGYKAWSSFHAKCAYKLAIKYLNKPQ